MTEIYLTADLKRYLMNDFNTNVLKEANSFWKLDDGVKDFLIQINSNNNIQSLYSKKHQGGFGLSDNSYLQFAYSKEIELKIFREVIPYFLILFNKVDESKFTYSFHPPEVSDDNTSREIKLGCLNDKNYFNVNSLKFELETYDSKVHDQFWITLGGFFTKITP